MPYGTADGMVTKDEDGLRVDWTGKRVWLNPPYGKAIIPFLERMRNGIALLTARTDNYWFHSLVVPRCYAIHFLRGRVRFLMANGRPSGTPAFASMLVAYSREDCCAIRRAGVDGFTMIPYQ